jgi:copper homeostasis protein CutC
MEVTFHRAFDETRNLPEALEHVIAAGAGRLLTSGGCARVREGSSIIASLVKQAAGRVQIAIGGGIDVDNVSQLVRKTGATHVHASLRDRIRTATALGDETAEGGRSFGLATKAVREFADAVRKASPLVASSR